MWAWTQEYLVYSVPALVIAPFTLLSTKNSRQWAFNTTCWHAWTFYRGYLKTLRWMGGRTIDRHTGAVVWRSRTRHRTVRGAVLGLLNPVWFVSVLGAALAIRWSSGIWALIHERRRAFASIPRNFWVGCWVRDCSYGLEVVPLAATNSVADWSGRAGLVTRGPLRKLPDHVLDIVRPRVFIEKSVEDLGWLAWGLGFFYLPVVFFAVSFRIGLKASLIIWGPLAYAADTHRRTADVVLSSQLGRGFASTLRAAVSLVTVGLLSAKVWALESSCSILEVLDGSSAGRWIRSELIDIDGVPLWQASYGIAALIFIATFVTARFGPMLLSNRGYVRLLRIRTLFYAFGLAHVVFKFVQVALRCMGALLRNIEPVSPFQ